MLPAAHLRIWLVNHPDASLNQAEREFFRMLTGRIDSTPLAERTYGKGHAPADRGPA